MKVYRVSPKLARLMALPTTHIRTDAEYMTQVDESRSVREAPRNMRGSTGQHRAFADASVHGVRSNINGQGRVEFGSLRGFWSARNNEDVRKGRY